MPQQPKSILKTFINSGFDNESESYLETLKEKFWSLTEHPLMGTERPELLAGIRSLPIESHILFYRVTAANVEITRVLHGRQDPARHLK